MLIRIGLQIKYTIFIILRFYHLLDIDSAEGVIAMAIRRLVHAPLPPSKFLEDSVLTTPSYSKINRVNYGIQEPANIPGNIEFVNIPMIIAYRVHSLYFFFFF